MLLHRMGEESDWASDTIGIRTPDNRTAYQVTGLEPFSVYSFRVIAVTSTGMMSIPSKESYYMVTLREIPDGRPVITSSGNVSSTSISLTWNPPPKHTIHGEFLGYRIKYRPTSDNNLKLIPTQETDHEEKDVILRDPELRVRIIFRPTFPLIWTFQPSNLLVTTCVQKIIHSIFFWGIHSFPTAKQTCVCVLYTLSFYRLSFLFLSVSCHHS